MNPIGFRSVITEGTNLSGKESYDHILLSPSHTREYLGAVWGGPL